MDVNGCFCLCFGILLSMAGPPVSSSSVLFISDGVFISQAYTACPVNFEFLNYTVMTDKCRGPEFPANLCCSALKDIACPYVNEINDLSNGCASTMFSYINLYGKYPPGLFASVCREGKDGLACPAKPPSPSDVADRNGASITAFASFFLVFLLVSSIMFFNQH